MSRGDLPISSRAHHPTKGLRVRLRTALKAAGITQKFRTDERRDSTLVVISNEQFVLPFNTFEDRQVQFLRRV